MTAKFDNFKTALAGLCLQYEVALRTEDVVYVIDWNRSKGVTLHGTDFHDGTREQPFAQDH